VIFDIGRRGIFHTLVAGRSSRALSSGWILCCLILCVSSARGSAIANRACAELFDPAALGQVRTFCVDTSNLEPGLASYISALVAKKEHSRNPLKHLPWKFTDQCAAADAVIRMYLAPAERHVRIEQTSTMMDAGVSYSNFDEPTTEVVLLVYERASLDVLYRTEIETQLTKPQALLKVPLSRLVKEANALRSSKRHRASRRLGAATAD
jgi:hypothetical protein